MGDEVSAEMELIVSSILQRGLVPHTDLLKIPTYACDDVPPETALNAHGGLLRALRF